MRVVLAGAEIRAATSCCAARNGRETLAPELVAPEPRRTNSTDGRPRCYSCSPELTTRQVWTLWQSASAPYSSTGAKRLSTTSVSRFFLETLVVASNDAGLAKATIDLGRSDVGRRHVGLDPSLPIVLSCAGMRSPRRPKLRSPCCAHEEGRDYWDLATLELQIF